MRSLPGDSAGKRRRRGDLVPAKFLDQRFDAQSLYQLRSAVAAQTAELGLAPAQANDILIAVHELASNVVQHGQGHGRLCGWTDHATLTCVVAEGLAGGDLAPSPGEGEPRAASGELPWPVLPGHGLWLVRRLADSLMVDRDDGVVIATITFATKPG